jgi:hypothetical protein
MKTVNGFDFSDVIVGKDLHRLVNQIWKLLPMRENEENWQKQLNSVLNELYGLHHMFSGQLDFLILISKLEGLMETDSFMTYRMVVFSAISILTELANQYDG